MVGVILIALKQLSTGGSMLAIIAAVLVVLWLLGFLAFHVSSGLCTQNAIWMWREE
jgi:hypothetical protein